MSAKGVVRVDVVIKQPDKLIELECTFHRWVEAGENENDVQAEMCYDIGRLLSEPNVFVMVMSTGFTERNAQ
jgi:hypothetical protein